MINEVLILKIAARYIQANPSMRKEVRDLVKPVNTPKGISKDVAKEHGGLMDDGNDDTVDPNRRDIRPQDVFFPKPNQVGVRNLAETGKDLSKAIENKIPKDKGYGEVYNLNQYLIEPF
jgi:hypothetical protein